MVIRIRIIATLGDLIQSLGAGNYLYTRMCLKSQSFNCMLKIRVCESFLIRKGRGRESKRENKSERGCVCGGGE